MTAALQLDLDCPPSNASVETECLNRIQAAFEAMGSGPLIYRGDQPRRLLRHLSRQVASQPESLSLHVRRVFLSIQLADKQELYGSLADLCWVLENRGQLLLSRLIEQAEALLSCEQQVLLDRYLENPDPAYLKQSIPPRSVLLNGRFSLKL